MSRAGSYASRKAAPHHRRRRGKRRPGGMKPAVAVGQRPLPQKSVPPSTAPPSPEPRPRIQKAAQDLAYVRRDLVRVGLVTGATILIMVILWLAL
jgi:hypothetical protein